MGMRTRVLGTPRLGGVPNPTARAARMPDEAETPMRELLPAERFAFASLAAERALVAEQ